MRKLIIVAVVLVVLVGLFAFALANLGNLVNRNKDLLLARAEQALGRRVTVEKIGVTLRGGIGVRLEKFAVGDDPAFSSGEFIQAKDLQVNAKLWPLFKKEFQISRVVLHEPLIYIMRNKEGVLNFSTLGAPPGTAAPAAGGKGRSGGASSLLIVSLVNVDDGTLTFVDKQGGTDLTVKDIDLEIENLDFERAIPFRLSAAVFSERQNVDVSGSVGPIEHPVNPFDSPLEARISLDPIGVSELRNAIPQLRAAIPKDVVIDGPASATVELAGSMGALRATATLVGTRLGVTVPGRFQKSAGDLCTVRLEAIVEPEKIAIPSLIVEFLTMKATGRGEIRRTTPPSMTFVLDSKEIPLAGWEKNIPTAAGYQLGGTADLHAKIDGEAKPGSVMQVSGTLKIADARATLPQFPKPVSQIRSQIGFSNTRADVKEFSVRVGGSEVRGSASVDKFVPLSATYRASAPSLTLADFRPPNPAIKKPEVMKDVSASGRMTVEKGVATNRGSISSAGGTVADVDYRDLKAAFSVTGKEAVVDSASLRALDGRIRGSGKFILDEKAPKFTVASKIQGVSLAQLARNHPALSKVPLQGALNMDLKISGSGKEWTDIQQTLSGDGLAEVLEGALADVNIASEIFSGLTRFPGLNNLITARVRDKYPKVFASPNTQFKDLKSDFVLENGKLKARNVKLTAADYSLKAKGALGLDRGIDLEVTFTASQALTSDLIKEVKEASLLANEQGQIQLPFQLTGTLPKVKISPDPQFLNQIIQKGLFQKGVEELKKKGLKDLIPLPKRGEGQPGTAKPDTTAKPNAP